MAPDLTLYSMDSFPLGSEVLCQFIEPDSIVPVQIVPVQIGPAHDGFGQLTRFGSIKQLG